MFSRAIIIFKNQSYDQFNPCSIDSRCFMCVLGANILVSWNFIICKNQTYNHILLFINQTVKMMTVECRTVVVTRCRIDPHYCLTFQSAVSKTLLTPFDIATNRSVARAAKRVSTQNSFSTWWLYDFNRVFSNRFVCCICRWFSVQRKPINCVFEYQPSLETSAFY